MAFTESEAYLQLKSIFKGDLVSPTDNNYKESVKRWSILAERPAGVVAFVRDEWDVSAAVKLAVEAKLEIAIKGKSRLLQSRVIPSMLGELTGLGGGHNPSGASSSDGGLVIDLSKHLNKVTVDQHARIAHVEGGALWSDVDAATFPFGLATVGGTVSEVSDVSPL